VRKEERSGRSDLLIWFIDRERAISLNAGATRPIYLWNGDRITATWLVRRETELRIEDQAAMR